MFVGQSRYFLAESCSTFLLGSIAESLLQTSKPEFVVLVFVDSFLVEVLVVPDTRPSLCSIDRVVLASFDLFLRERTGSSDDIESVAGFGEL